MGLNERIKYAEMKSRHQKKLTPMYKKWWGKILIIVLFFSAVFLVASGIYVYNEAKRINDGKSARYLQEQRSQYLEAINRSTTNTFGPKDARVTVVQFSDFSCPFCRDSHTGLKKIRDNYGDQVKIVYRDFPLHSNSIFLALAARCAGEQGKFWQMHDLFFENFESFSDKSQSELEEAMPDIALLFNLNQIQFKSCLDNQRYFSQIEQDFLDADYLQVEGTPTWFINNSRLIGHISEENLESLIVELLLKPENLNN